MEKHGPESTPRHVCSSILQRGQGSTHHELHVAVGSAKQDIIITISIIITTVPVLLYAGKSGMDVRMDGSWTVPEFLNGCPRWGEISQEQK